VSKRVRTALIVVAIVVFLVAMALYFKGAEWEPVCTWCR
jgi:hypothetical protein